MQTRIAEVNRVLREQITGIRVIRAFGREEQIDGQKFTVTDRKGGVKWVEPGPPVQRLSRRSVRREARRGP